MKKVFLVIAIMAGCSTMAMAQRGTGTRPSQSAEYQHRGPRGGRMSPEEQVAHETERLTKRLELTEEQQVKVKAVLEAQAAEMKAQMEAQREKMGDDPEAMREQMEENRDAMREKMEERMKKKEAQIKALLTDEQKVAYDEMRSEMKERMQQDRKPSVNHADE
ncbi:MAG: Spy/CpxP family protein refolding chaperone [Mangrovibacterium sp.]